MSLIGSGAALVAAASQPSASPVRTVLVALTSPCTSTFAVRSPVSFSVGRLALVGSAVGGSARKGTTAPFWTSQNMPSAAWRTVWGCSVYVCWARAVPSWSPDAAPEASMRMIVPAYLTASSGSLVRPMTMPAPEDMSRVCIMASLDMPATDWVAAMRPTPSERPVSWTDATNSAGSTSTPPSWANSSMMTTSGLSSPLAARRVMCWRKASSSRSASCFCALSEGVIVTVVRSAASSSNDHPSSLMRGRRSS